MLSTVRSLQITPLKKEANFIFKKKGKLEVKPYYYKST